MINNKIVLEVKNLSKIYRLGEIGTGTISHDLNRWWAKIRGKTDPYALVGSTNDRTHQSTKGEYVKVLDGINFEVKQGEVLGIIGKNGAGKSTLLKVISQITSPSSGSIKSKGRVASLLEVGTGMHPEMTGKENVYLNGAILGMTKNEIDSKYSEIMEFAGCSKYANTPIKRYSSGMKVRLGFAVAAFLEPEILIVDEVLAVGDAEFQNKAIGKMQEISSGGGRTVLFVSHNMASIRKICSTILVLDKGEIDFVGDTNSGIQRYLGLNVSDRYKYSYNGFFGDVSFEVGAVEPNGISNKNSFDAVEEISFLFNFKLNDQQKNVKVYFAITNSEGDIYSSSYETDFREVLNIDVNPCKIQIKYNSRSFGVGSYSVYCNVTNESGEKLFVMDHEVTFKVEDNFRIRGNRRSLTSYTPKWELHG